MAKKITVKNDYIDKTIRTALTEGITVIVGRNGYGKSSFIYSLQSQLQKKNEAFVSWSDNEYGRGNGREMMLYNNNMEGLASMTCCSEGETMMSSFSNFFFKAAGAAIRKCIASGQKELFFFIDQLDSGLDCHQLDYIKEIIADTILPDLKSRNITGYILITANSFEVAYKEDCLDPVTGKHYKFTTLEEYKDYINSQYKDEE